jgi:hypothetical protein
MARYYFYLLVTILAFGFSVFVATNFSLKTEEKFVLVQKGELIKTAIMRVDNPLQATQKTDSTISRNRNQLNFDDLKIDGIGLDSSYQAVVQKFGKPLKNKKDKFDECGGDVRKTLLYSGLEIQLLGDGNGKNFTVISIDVKTPKWQFDSNIDIGSDIKDVQAKFGHSDNQSKEDGLVELWYGNGDGWANFYFRDNKLVKISWKYNFC